MKLFLRNFGSLEIISAYDGFFLCWFWYFLRAQWKQIGCKTLSAGAFLLERAQMFLIAELRIKPVKMRI